MSEGIEGFLIGGVGGILKALLGFLADLAGKEIGLLWNAKEDLRKLHNTLEVILASVSDAEKQQVSNQVARLWLKRIKDIAYDAEDIVDEVTYETIRQHERGDRPEEKLLDFFSSSNHLVFSYEVAKKVQDINKRLDEFIKNNKIARFPTSTTTAHGETTFQRFRRDASPRVIGKSFVGRDADKSEIIRKLISSKGSSSASSSSETSSSSVSSSAFSSEASDFPNNPYPEEVYAVSIVGMGGVGKTTLAGTIYKDKAVQSFNPKIWVCVAGDFVARTVLLEILKHIIPETNLNNLSALVTLENQVEEQLRGKKYLLVLDDMWNVRADEWEKLTRVLTVGVLAGSKILITSREVQESVNGGIPPYKLKQLRDEECWLIIKSKAFLDIWNDKEKDGDMVRIGREIAKKCMGLPLAAQSLGSLMYLKNKKSDWEMIRDNDIWNDKVKDHFNIIPILKLSYDDFPSELKQCFSYCSMFPKNWEISRTTLVQLWIAEGFLGTCRLEKGRSIEVIADKFFDRLVWCSFLDGVQRSTLDDIVTCKMHDLVHDLAKSVVGDQESTSLKVSELNNISDIRRLHLTLDEDLSASSLNCLSNAKKLRTLFIPESSKLVDPFIFSENNHLRVLHVCRSANDITRPKWRSLSMLKHLRYLRLTSLDLREVITSNQSVNKLYNLETLVFNHIVGVQIQNLLSIIQSLKKLRYLEVSFTDMIKLPDSVTSLCNLQTLNLNNCKLEVIPKSISGLKSLRFLNLSFNPFFTLPDSVTTLSNLETLDVNTCENLIFLPKSVRGLAKLRIFDFSKCPSLGALPKDLGDLTQLRYLSLDDTRIKVLPKSCANLNNLEYVNLYECEDPKYVKNWKKLRKFSSRMGNILGAGELVSLETLFYSVPEKCINEAECNVGIEELRNLNFLEVLSIRNLQNVEDPTEAERANLKGKHNLSGLFVSWVDNPSAGLLDASHHHEVIQALQPPTGLSILSIQNFTGQVFPTWMCVSPGLPNLVSLYLDNCKGIITLPDIGGFPSLTQLVLTDMHLLEELCYSYPSNCLQDLKIIGCKRLTEIPSFPSLTTLVLQKIDHKLVYSVGRNQTSLTNLYLESIEDLIYFPISILRNNSILQVLQIKRCYKLKGFDVTEDVVALRGRKVYKRSLQKLDLIDCPIFKFLPDLRGWTSLRELFISNCPRVKHSLNYDLKSLLFIKVLEVDFIKRDDQRSSRRSRAHGLGRFSSYRVAYSSSD